MSVLRLLLPGRADVGDLTTDRDATLQALADLYAYPDPLPARGWVRANFVSSLDGSATGGDGLSGQLGGDADQAVFHVLRGLCDAVLVGVGTARGEGYGLPKVQDHFADRRARAGQAPAPALAVVTGSGDVAAVKDLFGNAANPSYVVTSARADVEALRRLAGPDRVIVAGDHHVDPEDAVRALVAVGLRRVLLEGGPRLMGSALAAGRVDELCLTWSPTVLGGDGPRIAVGPDVRLVARQAHLIAAGDVLIGRWGLQPATGND